MTFSWRALGFAATFVLVTVLATNRPAVGITIGVICAVILETLDLWPPFIRTRRTRH